MVLKARARDAARSPVETCFARPLPQQRPDRTSSPKWARSEENKKSTFSGALLFSHSERETGIEPANSSLARRRSTTLLLAHMTDILKDDAQGRNRTNDIRIFSPPLYQLSYLGITKCESTVPVTGVEPVRVSLLTGF